MPKGFTIKSHLETFTQAWLTHIFATAAQAGVSVALVKSSNYRSFKIVQPG